MFNESRFSDKDILDIRDILYYEIETHQKHEDLTAFKGGLIGWRLCEAWIHCDFWSPQRATLPHHFAIPAPYKEEVDKYLDNIKHTIYNVIRYLPNGSGTFEHQDGAVNWSYLGGTNIDCRFIYGDDDQFTHKFIIPKTPRGYFK